MPDSLHALIGMAGLLLLAWALSERRFAVPWRAVAAGLALQAILALICLKLEFVRSAFLQLNDALLVLEKLSKCVPCGRRYSR